MSGTTDEARRFPSGIAGLDTILEGGFLPGGVYIVQGQPGAGKTILGNQMCFHHVAGGGRALYVTLLAESHSRMMAHMRPLSFFDETAMPDRLLYLAAFRELEDRGLDGLLSLVRREVRAHRATLLVLDGLVAAEETAGTPRAFKKFIHELQTLTAVNGSTAFLLTSAGASQLPIAAEHTMVDGVIEMSSRLYGRRAERDLQVLKRRGGGYLRGRHAFRITADGLVVHPCIELLLEHPTGPDRHDEGRLSSGVPGLDTMLGGGLLHPSSTLVIGPSGIGKTTLGLHFLGAGAAEEPGLHFGLYETPDRLAMQAAALGLPLADRMASGAVEILWQPTTGALFDAVCGRLLDAVRRRGVRRLFLDGVDGLAKIAVEPARVEHALTALTNEFRSLGVTTLYSAEADLGTPVLGNAYAGMTLQGVSAIAENVVVMRFVNLRSRHHRLVSVLKARNSRVEDSWRRYGMTDGGIVVEEDAAGAEAVLHALTLSAGGGATVPTFASGTEA